MYVWTIIDYTTEIEFCENNLINPKMKEFSEVNLITNEEGMVFHLYIFMSVRQI